MILHITDAKSLPGHCLHILFSNGQEGDVDMSRELTSPVFEALLDDDLFSRVEVDPLFHTVTWPDGADLAPEFLLNLLQHQQGRSPSGYGATEDILTLNSPEKRVTHEPSQDWNLNIVYADDGNMVKPE